MKQEKTRKIVPAVDASELIESVYEEPVTRGESETQILTYKGNPENFYRGEYTPAKMSPPRNVPWFNAEERLSSVAVSFEDMSISEGRP
jgi:hypothetical protein